MPISKKALFFQKYRQVLSGDVIHVRRADMQSIDAFMHINNVIGNEDDPASLIWQLSYIDSCHFYNITTSLISDLNSSFLQHT